ncbi:MAG: DNA translocase FtsK 4TM domain-containing protein, partial [Muribaculaceae bacterium]|nr:DNA translocase FtsK 4TM domain-containing protein [Muribaculaceae bacterium]
MDEFGMTGESRQQQRPRNAAGDAGRRAPRGNQGRGTAAETADSRRYRTSAKKNTPRQSYGISDFIFDRRTHMGLGVVLIVLAIVMAVVTISHLAHGGADQSLATGLSMTEIVESGEQVGNIGGAFGAKLSQWLMADGLGLGSFVLVVWMAILGLSLVGVTRCRFWTLTFRCLFTAIAISTVVGLLTFSSDSYTHWGGAHGHFLNQILLDYSTWVGAVAVSLIMVGLLASVYLNPLLKAKKAMNEKLAAIRDMRRERIERDRRRSLQDVGSTDVLDADTKLDARPVSFDKAEFGNPEPAYSDSRTSDSAENVSTENSSSNYETNVEMPNLRTEWYPHGTDDLSEEDTDDSEFGNLSDMPDIGFAIDSETDSATEAEPEPDSADSEPDFSIAEPERIEQADTRVAPGEHTGIDSPYDPRAGLSRYNMPGVDLLDERDCGPVVDEHEQDENKEMIVNTLKSYNIAIAKIEATVGPTVTRYEIVPAEGVRIAQIKNLEDDIALSLAALGIRIIAPIPGKGTVGIEVPNRVPRTVSIRSVLGSRKFHECTMKLPMAMGTTINNEVFIRDLADMPHLLVAGGSGQGKSVGLNCIIASLLYYKHPSELKLVLIDPKMVEFSRYSRLQNHYLAKIPGAESPVVTDPQEAVATLNSLCEEMDNRYRLLRDAGAVKVEEYNRKFVNRQLNPDDGHRYLPYVVIIVDEFADLIMTAGKEVSTHIARIAQKARAVGMHMIIATQRPSTDVITGMIKANFLGRIAFRVQQMVDSKTILDRPGANQLIGRGDMLFSHNGKLERVQCAFIDSDEVDRLTRFVDDQIGYPEPYLLPEPKGEGGFDGPVLDPNQRDPLFADCARFIVTQSTASTSSLQRRFSIGYNKAGKIMDQMEAAGIVGAS